MLPPPKSKGGRREKEERKRVKITVLIEATSFATQAVCNNTRAAHALRSDQLVKKNTAKRNTQALRDGAASIQHAS